MEEEAAKRNDVPRPHDHLPTQTLNILIVGSDGVGKGTLAQFIKNDTSLKIPRNIRMTQCLPLPENPYRPRIDFIVFIIKMNSRQTFEVAYNSIQSMDIEYIIGRSLLVVTRADCPSSFAVTIESVMHLSETMRIPISFASLEDSTSVKDLSRKVLRAATRAHGSCGYGGVSPLLLACSDMDLYSNTAMNGTPFP